MYGRRDLVEMYLGAQEHGWGGYYPESSAFNAALRAYHVAMLDGLGELFGLRLDARHIGPIDNKALFTLFASAANSLLALRTPWSGFLEAGLLVKKIEQAGAEGHQVMSISQHIDALADESRQAHLELLDTLVGMMLGDRANLAFSRARDIAVFQPVGLSEYGGSPRVRVRRQRVLSETAERQYPARRDQPVVPGLSVTSDELREDRP